MSYYYFQTTQDEFVLQELVKLMWLRISLNGTHHDNIKDELAYIGTSNINAVRRFCLHSKSVISLSTSMKLIETLLSVIREEMECLPVAKILNKNYNKKVKFNKKKNSFENGNNI